jgi:hypothetical protein
LSLDFAVEISLMSEDPQDTYNVMNAMQILLEEVSDVALRKQIDMISSRAFSRKIDQPHPLLGFLGELAKKDLRSKDPKKRQHALVMYKIFFQNWQLNDCMTFLFRLLADSDSEVLFQ